jgi:putative Mn2+ efflux pump MntP
MIVMAVFGFSTLLSVMGLGFLVTRLQPHIKLVRYRVAAILFVFLGLRMILRGLIFNGWMPLGKLWEETPCSIQLKMPENDAKKLDIDSRLGIF